MLVYIATYGCQANERDSETILGMLLQVDYQETGEETKADLIILNTCSIRDKAEQKVFSYLGTLRQLKEDKPGLVIALCGCMAQEEDMVDMIRRRAPFVDVICGTQRLHRLPEMVRLVQSGMGFQSDREEPGEIIEGLPSIRPYPFKALINITFGCDNFCTYCIVPYVRGRERGRRIEDVMGESRQRVDEGAVELMYLGQNVNAYAPFPELIRQAQGIDGLRRIRFLTSHPKDFHRDIIRAIADSPKAARHIHLPVQSGSNRILNAMNRGYSREAYLALTAKVRQAIPDVVLTTDIIVGFPGETDEDIADTLDLINQVGFGSAFTFMYSPRKGTPAAKMEKQIALAEKKARLQAVMDAQAAKGLQLHQSLVGTRMEVLAEAWDSGRLSGRGSGHQLIYFPGEPDGVGLFHRVEVTQARTWTLEGIACDE
ncbi:MAG: tRNA (N6-isopentenyl adenosine(37)-C2)-methylthiotransferase MiaB [Clostridiales bacterium]|nr:tRNA (N6-isopentenyl adenosine(37)-C2)-methylthiotransferase MiaB [Clostridiales bacterium]